MLISSPGPVSSLTMALSASQQCVRKQRRFRVISQHRPLATHLQAPSTAPMNCLPKSITCVSLVLVAGLVGCAHHAPMPPTLQPFAGKTVSIETWDGQWHTATPLLAKDGAAWDAGDDGLILPTSVKTVSTGSGASIGIGAGVGALSGLLVGVLMGLSAGDDRCEPNDICLFAMSGKQKAALYGLLMHLPGAALGAMVGSGFANQEVFEAPGAVGRTVRHLSVVPVRGGATGSLGWAF